MAPVRRSRRTVISGPGRLPIYTCEVYGERIDDGLGEQWMKTTFFSELLKSAKEAPRIYFAPVVGAINEVRTELNRIDEERRRSGLSSNDVDADKP